MLLAWTALAGAIASEVAATLSLKSAAESPFALATVIVGYGLSFVLLYLGLKQIDVSIAYAVWAGVGTAAIAVIGMATLGEPVTALKVASVGLVIAGVVGLNLGGAH